MDHRALLLRAPRVAPVCPPHAHTSPCPWHRRARRQRSRRHGSHIHRDIRAQVRISTHPPRRKFLCAASQSRSPMPQRAQRAPCRHRAEGCAQAGDRCRDRRARAPPIAAHESPGQARACAGSRRFCRAAPGPLRGSTTRTSLHLARDIHAARNYLTSCAGDGALHAAQPTQNTALSGTPRYTAGCNGRRLASEVSSMRWPQDAHLLNEVAPRQVIRRTSALACVEHSEIFVEFQIGGGPGVPWREPSRRAMPAGSVFVEASPRRPHVAASWALTAQCRREEKCTASVWRARPGTP